MRIKLDENMPYEAVAVLEQAGHDVQTVLDEQLQGQPYPVVAAHIAAEHRALVTLDRGFGDMRKYPPSNYVGFWCYVPPARTSRPS